MAALATALTAVADRQQVLRWRIPERDGVPYAVAYLSTPVPLPVRDLAPGTDLAGHLAGERRHTVRAGHRHAGGGPS